MAGDQDPVYAGWMKTYAEETLEDLTDVKLNTQALSQESADRFIQLFRRAKAYHAVSAGWHLNRISTSYGPMYRVLIQTALGDVAFGTIALPGLPVVYFYGFEDRLCENLPQLSYELEVVGLQAALWEEAYGFPSTGLDDLRQRILKHLPAFRMKSYH